MKRNNRILILANDDEGLYQFRRMLLESLLGKGNKIYISCPKREYSHRLVEMGCVFFDTPIDRRGVNPKTDFKLFLRYLRILKKIKPAVVFTYTIKPNVYGGIACELTKTNYFVNITGLGTSLENKSLVKKISVLLYRMGIRKADCVFFQNTKNQQFFIDNKIHIKKQVLLPGSGVDLSEHSFREFPEQSSSIIFMMVGRVMKEKGVSEYIEAAHKIRKSGINAKFWLVGPMEEGLFTRKVEWAQKSGDVKYLGKRNDVPDLMSKAHCLIHPSYHEGMSNVILEAAACGRPVLASNIPGCREGIDDGVTGFLFEPKNTDSLVKAIQRFCSLSREQMAEMGKAGREKVEHEFDRNIVVAAYMNELKQLRMTHA